jgi:lysophospholipase L1-like esterase
MTNPKSRWWPSCIAILFLLPALAADSAYALDLPGRVARPKPLQRPASDCTRTSVGFTPLNDLGTGTYNGYQGGLYMFGSNRPPLDYRWMGQAHAQLIVPLNAKGNPDPNGRLVLLSIGMSNTTQEFSTFKPMADADPQKNPKLTIVDGAQGGQDAEIIRNPSAQYWTIVDQRLTAAGVTPNQVEAAWLKEAVAGESRTFPADAVELENALRDIVGIMRTRYPNLQIVFLSSRIYAGYATTTLNPEPHAYNSAFSVKWLIEEHINSLGDGPWLDWGPYLWADGLTPRSDGLIWECADFQSDGTHPSASGRQKVANMLLDFFKTNEMAVGWFLRGSASR